MVFCRLVVVGRNELLVGISLLLLSNVSKPSLGGQRDSLKIAGYGAYVCESSEQAECYIGKGKNECCTRNHGNLVLHKLHLFFKEGVLSDFEIKVEKKVFKVHRVIMASCSDYFEAMFSHDVLENKQSFTELKGVTISGLEPLIGYAYTGKILLTLDNIHDIFSAANFLQMQSAIELCTDFLKEKMTFENADELLKIGEVFSVPVLKSHYRSYLMENFLQFAETDFFLQLDAETLADYLSDDSLKTSSESKLLSHVLKWYNFDRNNREKHAFQVFEKIRYVNDDWPAILYAEKHEPFISNLKCREIISFCTDYLRDSAKRYLHHDHRTRTRYPHKTLVQIGGVITPDFDFDGYSRGFSGINDLLLDGEAIGWSQNHFYNPKVKSWFPLGRVKLMGMEHRSHSTVVEVEDSGILCGGYKYHIHEEGDVLRDAIREVKLFSPADTSMWDMPPMKHERAHHASVALPGFIYVIGGKDDRKSLSSVERLDCWKEYWDYMRPLPKASYDHAAGVVAGKIYVTGGVINNEVKDFVWCYDPQKNKWQKRASLLTARAGHAMACVSEKLYVCGGYVVKGSPRCLSTVETYSVIQNQWTTVKPMIFECSNCASVVLNERILLLGGENVVAEVLDLIQEYNPAQDRWQIYGVLPRPLKNLTCCAVTVKLTEDGEEDTDSVLQQYANEYQLGQDQC
ncbi:hypothetical protein ScPMuIL_010970 [Solemya velum]